MNKNNYINLRRELRGLAARNRDGSFSTQHTRRKILDLCARQLQERGYYQLSARGLKPKHIHALINRWQTENLSVGTLKNRIAAIRWWTEKVNKVSMMPKDNRAYGIQSRVFVTHRSKALSLTAKDWSKIADPRLLLSLKLQQAFGLRREECLKFQPSYADKGNYIRLKDTWTKGGKARRIPIVSHAQRVLLNQVHQVAGKGSLIPPEKSYVQQMHYYDRITHQAGLKKLHGLRHAYTQARYEAITGFKCPVQGGKNKRHMTPSERQKDERARLIISRELGHEREEITAIYLGR